MPLTTLNIAPGIVKEDTAYAAEGRWLEGNLVRFRDGKPENIRGWHNLGLTLTGVPRAVLVWRDLSGFRNALYGTTAKLQLMQGGVLYDLTPIRATTTATANLFTTASGSSIVTVNDSGHNATVGSSILVSSASATVGGLTLDGEYIVTTVPTASTFTFDAGSNASSSTTGPASATIEYLLNISQASSIVGLGWGAGAWGQGTWGTPREASLVSLEPGQWSLANWGEDALCCPRDGAIYFWDRSAGTSTRAAIVSTAPTKNRLILVAEGSRFVVALGTEDTIGSTATHDPLLVRWCHQEDYTEWQPTATNTAGFQRLSGGTKIITGVVSRREILIWTDDALWQMRQVTSGDVFVFQHLGAACGAIGQHAAIDINGIAYWMGDCNFYIWDGTIRVLDCPMHSDVFENLDRDNADKFFTAHNRAETEVMFFWQDRSGTDINRLSVYNYRTNLWWEANTLPRTTWSDTAIWDNPIATNPSGTIYYQDTGNSADGAAMNCYIESSDVDIGDGQDILFSTRFFPDFVIDSGSVEITLRTRNYDSTASPFVTKGPFTVTNATNKINTRLRGRQARVRYESDGTDNKWRGGQPRLDANSDGER